MPLASRRCADQHARAVGPAEAPLGRKLRAVVAAAQYYDSLAWIGCLDLRGEQVDGAEIGREDNDLLLRIAAPEGTERCEQLLNLCFVISRKNLQQLADALAGARSCRSTATVIPDPRVSLVRPAPRDLGVASGPCKSSACALPPAAEPARTAHLAPIPSDRARSCSAPCRSPSPPRQCRHIPRQTPPPRRPGDDPVPSRKGATVKNRSRMGSTSITTTIYGMKRWL